MEATEKRIHGTEMEWSTMIPSEKTLIYRQLTHAELLPRLEAYQKTVPYIGTPENCFLGNGARMYIDIHNHYETTTPEDDSFIGTTASEMAGERIMRTMFGFPLQDASGKAMNDLDGLAINKRVMDDAGNRWGAHESYLTTSPRLMELSEKTLSVHGLHLATRSIYAGAGALDRDGNFWIAQKASGVNCSYVNGTTTEKPVVNLRNEPHADSTVYRRIHVTSGDPTMSPWSTRMKLGTTSLVLRLEEEGIDVPNIHIQNKLYIAARNIAGAVALSKIASLENQPGGIALAVQTQLFKACQRLANRTSLPEEELWVLDEWERVLADLQRDPHLARNRVEWVLKLEMLQKRHDSPHNIAWDNAKMRSNERSWDMIWPDDRVSKSLRETIWSEWMPDESLIASRVLTPPQSTRAKIRSEFIRHFSGRDATVGWAAVGHIGKRVSLAPSATQSADVDALIAADILMQQQQAA